MEKNLTGNKIKILRTNKGYSQDHLASLAQISLRTVQRIENGETEARGDTLNRLAKALGVTVEELLEVIQSSTANAYNGNLMLMNLLGLGCIIYGVPFLGLILPLGYWLAKKDELAAVVPQARKIINFQLTLALLQFLFLITMFLSVFGIHFFRGLMELDAFVLIYVTATPLIFNIGMIVFNAIRINHHKTVIYWPAIPFLRARRG